MRFFFILCVAISFHCFGFVERFELKDSGFHYVYDVESAKGPGGELKRNGKITVTGSDGLIVSSHVSELLPGCSNGFSAVKIIELDTTNFPLSNKYRSRKYIAFCGNSDGKHNVLMLYQPFRGFIGSLDFLEGPVNLSIDEKGIYRFSVEYKIFIGSVGGVVSYPVFYMLKPVGVSVGFTQENDFFTYKMYEKLAEEEIDLFQHKGGKYNAARALLLSNISGDVFLYCSVKKMLHRFSVSSISSEIESKFNSILCEG